MTATTAAMNSTYQELLKKSYIQRLRNKKVATGNDILLQLDRISEDYNREVASQVNYDQEVTEQVNDFFDEVNEYEDLESVD